MKVRPETRGFPPTSFHIGPSSVYTSGLKPFSLAEHETSGWILMKVFCQSLIQKVCPMPGAALGLTYIGRNKEDAISKLTELTDERGGTGNKQTNNH